MAKRKFSVEFEGFDEVLSKLHKLNGDIRGTTDRALRETHKIVTAKADEAIAPHSINYTGDTRRSLVKSPEIEWVGDTASVKVGFNIRDGGLPSIFLMYGTPRMKKDQKLYNAFYGKKTETEVKQAQENIFWNELRRLDS